MCGLHVPSAVRVANDISVVGLRHGGGSLARDSLCAVARVPEEIPGSVRVGRLQYWDYSSKQMFAFGPVSGRVAATGRGTSPWLHWSQASTPRAAATRARHTEEGPHA